MLITALLDFIYNLLSSFLVFELPGFPDSLLTLVSEILDYIMLGFQVLSAFVGPTAMTVLGVCFSLVVFANAVYFTISLTFWFVRKIPMLNIKE